VSTARDWAELLRVPATFTVPGDVLAGAAATGHLPRPHTALAAAASLCLYQAGMALNDWADRAEDAAARPHRPIPSGRITPTHALAAAAGLTAAGLGLAIAAGRPAAWCATALAGTVWAYDLHLKHTPAGPATMATARALDLLLGAAATRPHPGTLPTRTGDRVRRAALPAAILGAHTYATTAVSRHETSGGTPRPALAALGATAALAAVTATTTPAPRGGHRTRWPAPATWRGSGWMRAALAGGYAATAGRPLLHAALNPSPPLTQAAVGGQIRATIPLQAVLAHRAGAPVLAGALTALAPLARAWARKVSPT
jgi:UbiA prenyltransferase family